MTLSSGGGESDLPACGLPASFYPSGQQSIHFGEVCPQIQECQCAYVASVEEIMCVVCVSVAEGA